MGIPDRPATLRRNILVVAVDEAEAKYLRSSLENLEHQVIAMAATGTAAIDLAREHAPDLVLMDVVLDGDMNGIEAATLIQQELAISTVFTCSQGDGIRLAHAKKAQPAGFLFKPFDLKVLHCTLEVAFSKVDLQRQMYEQTSRFEALDERREKEFDRVRKQLFDSKKMEIVGALTGIIAHDFNNMLLPILGYSNLLVDALQDQPELSKMASEISTAANDSTSLTRQLLAFSRRQICAREVVDINALVEEAERMLRCLVGDRFSLILKLEDEGIHGNINPGQIEQVLLNLCVNSRDAMLTGGSITVSTELLRGNERLPKSLRGDTDRAWICITVADEGRGMRPEVCERIFQPYFTTKNAEGAGLGLSVAMGIISQHGGYLKVDSVPGIGTNVHIYLPAEDVVVVDEMPEPAVGPVSDTRGSERILVIEDEPQILAFVACALTNKGYVIETASDLASARRLLSESRESGGYDLILSDCVLPDGTGVDCLVEQLREFPDTKAILTTGYTVQEHLLDAVSEYDIGFLQKPYALPKLFDMVRHVLDEDLQKSA